jgi:hypothetical protein
MPTGRAARAGKSLGRKVGVRRPRKTVMVFCEGSRTEPEYLGALKRLPEIRTSAAVQLVVRSSHGGSPIGLVTEAASARRRALREQAELDEFWCVFDVEWPDNHPGLAEAVAMAQREGIHLAISNPCFELWLVLHHQDCRRWLTNSDARRLRTQATARVARASWGRRIYRCAGSPVPVPLTSTSCTSPRVADSRRTTPPPGCIG